MVVWQCKKSGILEPVTLLDKTIYELGLKSITGLRSCKQIDHAPIQGLGNSRRLPGFIANQNFVSLPAGQPRFSID